jgi:hypothetical protein
MSQFIYQDNDGDKVTVDTKDSLSVEELKLELHELKAQLLEVLREERNTMLDTLDKRYVHCLDHGLDVAPVLAEKAVLKDITEPLKAIEVVPGTPVTVEAIEELHEAASVLPVITSQIQQLQITPAPVADTDAVPMLNMPEAMSGEGVIYPAVAVEPMVEVAVVEEAPTPVEEPAVVVEAVGPVQIAPTPATQDETVSLEAREEAQGPTLPEEVVVVPQEKAAPVEAPLEPEAVVTVDVISGETAPSESLEAVTPAELPLETTPVETTVGEVPADVAVEPVVEPSVEIEATVDELPTVTDYPVEAGTDMNPDYPLEAGLPVEEAVIVQDDSTVVAIEEEVSVPDESATVVEDNGGTA